MSKCCLFVVVCIQVENCFGPGAVNQVNNMVQEMAHPWLGPDTALSVWMLELLLENLGIHKYVVKYKSVKLSCRKEADLNFSH